MEFLFNGTNPTDGLHHAPDQALGPEQIEPDFRVGGELFGPEMMLSLLYGQPMVQIPVNYTKRVGTSSVTGDPLKAVQLGVCMILLILEYRLRSLLPGVHRLAKARPAGAPAGSCPAGQWGMMVSAASSMPRELRQLELNAR